MKQEEKAILVDAREFILGRLTGIGRVLIGLLDALAAKDDSRKLVLALHDNSSLPPVLRERSNISTRTVPASFWRAEMELSRISPNGFSLFISPYPKLPFFGCGCVSINIIHDILDLTHPAYAKRAKVHFDTWRLKRALRRADLTWYDSQWSLDQTRKHADLVGKNPRVRYPGIGERFVPENAEKDTSVWKKHGLEKGYILALGNGLPHKNLGVLLEIADRLPRKIVVAGASEKAQMYWKERFPAPDAAWIRYVPDEDLPPLLRGAFCLVQPSTAEGYGYPPLEAMACGIPAVISEIPVLKETTGGNALTAEAGKPEKWLEALSALENDAFYHEQVERGLHWVVPLKGRIAWHSYVSDVEELLNMN